MNKKPLNELLVEKASESKRGQAHASFLLQKTEILNSIKEGWSIKFVWKTLTDAKRIDMSYEAFWRLVRRHEGSQGIANLKTPTTSSNTGLFTIDAKPNKSKLY